MHEYFDCELINDWSFSGNVTDIDDAVNWLKLYNEPESKLVDLWRKTARTRLLFINSSEEVTLLKVLDEWPRYRDARGHVLVRLVIEKKYLMR